MARRSQGKGMSNYDSMKEPLLMIVPTGRAVDTSLRRSGEVN